jgi:hypothetical protein
MLDFSPKMEPQKRAQYSKLIDTEEMEEILMEEESDEELELNEFIEPHGNYHHQVMRHKKQKLGFMLEDLANHQRYSISLVLQVESTDQPLPI